MVRETRHLWVGNLPDNVREERIRDHFKRYGRVQNVKLLPAEAGSEGGGGGGGGGGGAAGAGPGGGGAGLCAAVAFIDIRSAAKAHHAEHTLDERRLTTVYYEPTALPPTDTPTPPNPTAADCYTGNSGSTNTNTVGSTGINNAGYSSQTSERTRPRDRLYRNGPTSYNSSGTERNSHQRWYNSSYGTSPTAGSESLSVAPTGGVESNITVRRRGRSGSSSASRSSSRSISSSSAGRSASSSSSRASSPTADHRRKHKWSGNGSNSRTLAICVRNLPQRSSDSSLKDGLYHEYKKHGKVSCVKVVGTNQDRHAVVYFKKHSDVEKALEVSQDKLFFGCKISVSLYQGMDVEDNESRPYETDLDEFHPKATRTLFIGNLEKDVNSTILREKFKHFGKIIEIDIKKSSGGAAGYAFCQFANISSVVDAIRSMDGEHVGGTRVKLGFGKSMATSCIWIDGVADMSEKQLYSHCARFGPVTQVTVCNGTGHALVVFEQVASAQQAVKELRGLNIRGRKLQVDFASRECQDAFYEQRETQCSNPNSMETRTSTDSRFSDLPSRNFDSSKYTRYETSPRARQVAYNRSRNSRFLSQSSGEHFESTTEFSDRRFRYDEFSGGSGSETTYDTLNSTLTSNGPALQSVVVVSSPGYCPGANTQQLAPNIRHLQKERVHLLEQLEECPSSGDELVSPKKRFKSERVSLGRRPSIEASRHHREASPCVKRRRGSETSRHHWHTSSPISRPGTPLHDERPDSPVPTEPRRLIPPPRRTVPMCLPLPRFAAQILQRSNHISPPHPPLGPPPPASPASQRIPSPASSGGSSPSPAEPSLDERIRSLDERYEKWSGSRASAAPECPERSRFRHHLLDLDVAEVQPSEVMRSVLAKRSVFDEDSKRLENISDKYNTQTSTSAICAFPSPGAQVSPSPLNSPQSAGRSPYAGSPSISSVKAVPPTAPPPPATPAKGLQYPFPSHPPMGSVDNVTSSSLSSILSDYSEDIPKGLFTERLSVNHIDSNIPRNNANLTSCNDRVPVSLSYNTETTNNLTSSVQNSVIQKTKGVSLKSEFRVTKINKNNSLVNSNELDAITEGDVKIECSNNVNSDNLDRRKSEQSDVSFINIDTEASIKENKDQSTNVKVSGEKSYSDKKNCDKSSNIISFPDKYHSEMKPEIKKQNSSEEKKKTTKEERYARLFSDREIKKHCDERKKKDEIKEINEITEKREKSLINIIGIASVIENINEKENNHGAERLENERKEREQLEKEKAEHDRIEKERKETEKIERERLDKDRKEKDRLEQVEKERIERELFEKERREKEKMERERREKEKIEKERREKERIEKDKIQKQEKERIEKERLEKDKHEKSDRILESKSEKHDRKKERDVKKREDKDVNDSLDFFTSHKERKKEKDDHCNENRHKHRDNHKKDVNDRSEIKKDALNRSHENKSKDNNNRKLSRDETTREIIRKDSCDSTTSRNSHDSNKSKDQDIEMKDESHYLSKHSKNDNHKNRHHDKECLNKSTNKYENDVKVEFHKKDKASSLDSDKTHHSELTTKEKKSGSDDKQRHYSFDSHSEYKTHDSKRKERLNSSSSLPANIGIKRRVSSHEGFDQEDCKKPKLNVDKKVTERRDSKDCNKHSDKNKHTKNTKNNVTKQLEEKIRDDRRSSKECEEKYKNKDLKDKDVKEKEFTIDKENFEKIDVKKERICSEFEVKEENEYREKESRDHHKSKVSDKIKSKKPVKECDVNIKVENTIDKVRDLSIDKEFLERLELRSSQEDEKQQALKKEMKERKRQQQLQQIQQLQLQQNALQEEKKTKSEDRKKEMKEKRISTDRKSRDECINSKSDANRKKISKNNHSTDTSDSDEPKKHSIFDIIDDGPTYISMYDKVKARSCKNMQKQEEEKRQEKIKAKFSQLKQSRAKREEKKRSSWDEDSDSDRDHKKSISKSFIASSSEDEFRRRHKGNITTDSENDHEKFKISQKKSMDSFDGDRIDDARNKMISRKNSRSRIVSDTSEDESSKRTIEKIEISTFSTENISNQESKKHLKYSHRENNISNKVEHHNILYEGKSLNINNKRSYYENNVSLKNSIEDKKPIIESEGFVKSEHYIKTEPAYKYDSQYSDNDYDMYPSEVIISDSAKSKSSSESRKKHKKKQKRPKSYPSDDEINGIFDKSVDDKFDRRNNSTKKRHTNKKDKKREKTKINEMDIYSAKIKSKKFKGELECNTESKPESHSNFKRDEIMHDIFGPLSDEGDEKIQNNFNTILKKCNDEDKNMSVNLDLFNTNGKNNFFTVKPNISETKVYNLYAKSDIDVDLYTKDNKIKEENKKRKDKKRKERKSINKDDDNSLDVDAAGKAIEASLCADSLADTKKSSEKDNSVCSVTTNAQSGDVFRFNDMNTKVESPLITPHQNHIKKEIREKKKKKKRDREDRQSRKEHHHHHHHHKEKNLESELKNQGDVFKTDIINISCDEEKSETSPVIKCNPTLPSPSLPRLTDSPPLINKQPEDPSIVLSDTLTSPVINTTGKLENRRSTDKFIPGFGVEIDDTMSENAVKSISDFENSISERKEIDSKLNLSHDHEIKKVDDKIEEKPRAVISQEETEDAVAALLGESFGSRNDVFNDCYDENTPSPETRDDNNHSEDNNIIPDDEAEEMRKAVQSLNASELEIKPETPQSENDLQIDTDTDDGGDEPKISSVIKIRDSSEIEARKVEISPFYRPESLSNENKIPITSENPVDTKDVTNNSVVMHNKDNIEEGTSNIASSGEKNNSQSKVDDELIKQIHTPPPTVISKGWSLSAHKPSEQSLVINSGNTTPKDDKSVHITTSILHFKPIAQTINVGGQCRPLLTTAAKVPGSYQVINQLPRPTTLFNTQPPTIKIPDQHLILQRQPSIMISPKMATDIRVHSPKTHQHIELQSKVTNMAILTTGPSNLGSPSGIASPSTIQQRSPSQITVVRMQQPPLSPIQSSHLPVNHQSRSMLSPNHHNTVVIQNQNSTVQLTKLPLTPILTPISKPMITGNLNIPQPKSNITSGNTTIIQSPKMISSVEINKADVKCSQEQILSNTKLIFSTSTMNTTQNSTVMIQNRLITTSGANQNPPILLTSHVLNKTGSNSSLSLEKSNESLNLVNGTEQIKTSNILNNQNLNQVQQCNITTHTNSQVIHSVPKMSSTIQELSSNVQPNQNSSQQIGMQMNMQNAIYNSNAGQTENSVETANSTFTPVVTKTQNISPIVTPMTSSTTNYIDKTSDFCHLSIKKSESEESNMDADLKIIDKIEPPDSFDLHSVLLNNEQDKSKEGTDFEELLKQNAIVTKIEKTASESNNSVNVKIICEDDIKEENSKISVNTSHVEDLKLSDTKTTIDHKSSEIKTNEIKDIVVDSVIKKLDSVNTSGLLEDNKNPKTSCVDNNKTDQIQVEKANFSENINVIPNVISDNNEESLDKSDAKANFKRGTRARNKKIQNHITERIQTRQGNKPKNTSSLLVKKARGKIKIDKKIKPLPTATAMNEPGDVYDFHEDSGDEVENSPNKNESRPRLILTIKSPVVNNMSHGVVTATNTCKENALNKTTMISTNMQIKDDKVEDHGTPPLNTRKSRRLQEKDVIKNSVDDIIEDVVRNSSQNRVGVISVKETGPTRRSTRQNKVVSDKNNSDLRKSPRALRKTKNCKLPENSPEKNEEKIMKKEIYDPNCESVPNDPESTEEIVKVSFEEKVDNDELKHISDSPKPSKIVDEETDTKLPLTHITEMTSSCHEKADISKNIVEHTTSETKPILNSDNSGEIIKETVITSSIPTSCITSKITNNSIKIKSENAEELMIDPVTGELVYMRHGDDGNFIPVSGVQTNLSTNPIATQVNNIPQRISEAESLSVSPIIKQPYSSCITSSALSVPTSEMNITSVVKSPNTNIQLNSPRIQVTGLPIATPVTHSVSVSTSDVKSIIVQASTAISSVSNSAYQSVVTMPQLHTTSSNIISRTPASQNQFFPGKIQPTPLTTMPIKSAPINAHAKPVIAHINPQLQSKSVNPIVQVPHNAILTKTITGPLSPHSSHMHNLAPKVQQLKSFPMQPQIAHPPQQKQIMQLGPTGALGSGSMGPSLPRGAQHSSPPLLMAKHATFSGSQPVIAGASSSRVGLTAVPAVSPQSQVALRTDMLGSRSPPPAHQQTSPVTPGDGAYPQFAHQSYQYYRAHQEARTTPSPYVARSPHGAEGSEAPSPPLELRRPPCARVPHPAHSPSLSDRSTDSPQTGQIYTISRPSSRYADTSGSLIEPPTGGRYYDSPAPPPAHVPRAPCLPPSHHRILAETPVPAMPKMSITQGPGLGMAVGGTVGEERGPSRGCAPTQGGVGQSQSSPGPPHASHAPREADSLMMLLRRYPVMWQGLLALKNDAAAVQMHFVHGNPAVAGQTLPCNGDGSTAPLRIAQRMRLEPVQLEAVARKMQMENEHCMLLALPCGRDHLDVLQQSTHLTGGFITYLRRKQAAGIVNIAPPGHHQALFTVHIFPSCDFANENLERIAPDLLHRVANIAHLLIVIATV